jgi:hypothetical protein
MDQKSVWRSSRAGGDARWHRLGFVVKEADLPLEVVILMIGGMALLITGILLFPVSDGALP